MSVTAGGFRGHRHAVRVYYEDTDAMGVVYYANYLRFMERGRTEWLRSLGVQQDRLLTVHGVCFTVAEITVKYLQPARFNDELVVETATAELGRARIVVDQAIRRADGQLLCSGKCTVACLEAAAFRPTRIPQELLALWPAA